MPTSNVNNTTTTYEKPSLDSIGIVGGLVTFYVLVDTCAIASNITILIAIVRRLVPRNTVNVFFSSLAVSDILMVVLSLLDCFAYLNGSWEFGESICKIQSLFLEVSFSASTLTLVAVSCERYLLICQPHMKRRTLRNIYYLLAAVWIVSFMITSPLLHGYIVYEDIDDIAKTRELVCGNKGWSRKYLLIYYSTYSMVVYLLPLLLMAFTHWRISRSVRDNHRRQKFSQASRLFEENNKNQTACLTVKEESSGGSDITEESNDVKPNGFHKVLLGPILQLKMKASYVEREHKRNDRRIKAVRMLFVVTVTFFILWTPFIILRVVDLCGRHIDSYIYKFSEILILSSTAVNGFIYAYMSPPFRKAFKAILCCQEKSDIILRYTGATLSNSEDQKTSKKLKSNISPDIQQNDSLSKKKFDTCLKYVNGNGLYKKE